MNLQTFHLGFYRIFVGLMGFWSGRVGASRVGRFGGVCIGCKKGLLYIVGEDRKKGST